MAFPPTVNEEMNADKTTDIIVLLMPNFVDKDMARTAPNPPDTIPQTSPITSLQIDDILLPLFIKVKASLAPFTLADDIEWNVASLAVIPAVPIASKSIPMDITATIMINKIISLKEAAIILETVLKQIDKTNVKINIVIIKLFPFFISSPYFIL